MSVDRTSTLDILIAQLQLAKKGGSSSKTSASDFSRTLAEASGRKDFINKDGVVAEAVMKLMKLEMMRASLTDGAFQREKDGYSMLPNIRLSQLGAFQVSQKYDSAARHAETLPRVHATQSEKSVEDIIKDAAQDSGVPSALVKAVIKAESDFDEKAVSKAGAEGLMQLMPETAKSLGVTDSFDSKQNVMAGARYLKKLLVKYEGDLDSALAAYNWGPGNVDRKGLPLMPRETIHYLARVKKYYSDFLA